MRNPDGYAVLIDPRNDRAIEVDTFMCVHCNAHHHLKAGVRPEDFGGWCMNCSGPVCPKCSAARECRPLMKWVEEMEAKDRFRREVAG